MRVVRPKLFHGSYLEIACVLDAACPGFLGRVLYASDLRRSVTFVALAEFALKGPMELVARLSSISPCCRSVDPDDYSQIARTLVNVRARKIISAIFGSAPDGFVGLLARLGADPLPDLADYHLAYTLFADPQHTARAKLLRQSSGRLSAEKIKVAAKLDPALLHVAAFERIGDMQRVDALHAALAIIRALVPEATDETLHRSLGSLSPNDHSLAKWVQCWLRRMTRVPNLPPIPFDDPDLRVLHGCDMVEIGRRFQNCAATRLGYLALGTRAYAEWIGPGEPAVVELRGLSNGGFVIEDIKGVNNSEPNPEVGAAIRQKLASMGIFSFAGPGESSKSNAIVHLLSAWDAEQGEPTPFLTDVMKEAA